MKLRFSRRAEREVDRIDERWRAERKPRERGLRRRPAGGIRWPGLAGEAATRVLGPAGLRLLLGHGRLRGRRPGGRFPVNPRLLPHLLCELPPRAVRLVVESSHGAGRHHETGTAGPPAQRGG